jgi:hypothetical protein
MLKNFVLDHHEFVLEPDMLKWAMWMEENDTRVASTDNGVIWISTVFLGIDHNFLGGPPLLFETMTFLGDDFEVERNRHNVDFEGLETWRWSTWEQAEQGHWEICRRMFRRLDQFKGPIAEVIQRMRLDTTVG